MEHSFLNNKKILLVDDEPDLLKLVSDILIDDGFINIVTATTVKDGISVSKNERPDLAILDVMLPDGDGFFPNAANAGVYRCANYFSDSKRRSHG